VRWLHGWIVAAVALSPGIGTSALASEVTASCERVSIGHSVSIEVQGVRSGKGTLVAVLYGDDPGKFLKKGARIARERVPARPGSVTVCLAAPGPGTYAAAVYHDENDNRRFDRSWTGLPREGFGVSNNPQLFLRAPNHAESAFEVRSGANVVKIDLRY